MVLLEHPKRLKDVAIPITVAMLNFIAHASVSLSTYRSVSGIPDVEENEHFNRTANRNAVDMGSMLEYATLGPADI